MRTCFFALALSAVLIACGGGDDASREAATTPDEPSFRIVEPIDQDMHRPWSIAFVSETEWLVTERRGHLRVVRDGVLDPNSVAGAPRPVALMEGGMLDVVLHPGFESNRLVYLTWTRRCPDCGTTLAVGRGTWDGTRLNDFEEIFTTDACGDDYRHYGGRLVFDGNGYMFLSIGERNNRNRAQNTGDDAGSILRLHDDGRIPEDNPLADTDGASPAIWSWGHRNPQGLVFHPETGELWQHEHGPSGGDELNLIRPGLNYGWPEATHGREYFGPEIGPPELPGMESPLTHWTPSIAPSGLAFYFGDKFPEWHGSLFMGSLSRTSLVRLELDGYEVVGEERLLGELGHRIRDVRVGPDGLLYLLVDHELGGILRLEPR